MCYNMKQEGDNMMSTFEIRLSAIQDHFHQDHNKLRYLTELKRLRTDVGRSANEDDMDMLYLFSTISRELSFVTGSKTTV